MIPPFCDGMNLPAGLHAATLEEVQQYFGTSPKRAYLCGRLQEILQTARECHFRKVILFGSFVSSKVSPGDIDLFWTLAPGTDTDELPNPCRELLDAPNSKSRFMCDVFWCFDDEATINYMTTLWELDRTGRTRGLVMIELQ